MSAGDFTSWIAVANVPPGAPRKTADAVQRYYRFTNSTAGKLGKEPLPDGVVKAFSLTGADQLYRFIGSSGLMRGMFAMGWLCDTRTGSPATL